QRLFLNKVQFPDANKNYRFEYNDLSGVPQRLSYRQDHWGYFNDKPNTTLFPDLSSLNNTNGNRFAAAFSDGANRDIDETKAKKGLLTKVIYPTKGYATIDYESNTYNTPQSTSNMAYVYLNTSTTGSTSSNSDSVTLTDVAVSGLRPLNMNFNLNYQNSCATQGPVPNEADRKLNITIENLTNSSQANIIQKMNGTTGTTLGIGNSVALTIDDVYNGEYYFNLTANNNYQITINLYYVCLYGQLSFTYPNTTAQITYVNKKTGGLRVSKTTNYDNNN